MVELMDSHIYMEEYFWLYFKIFEDNYYCSAWRISAF